MKKKDFVEGVDLNEKKMNLLLIYKDLLHSISKNDAMFQIDISALTSFALIINIYFDMLQEVYDVSPKILKPLRKKVQTVLAEAMKLKGEDGK